MANKPKKDKNGYMLFSVILWKNGRDRAYRAEKLTIERRESRGSAKSSEMDLMPVFLYKA